MKKVILVFLCACAPLLSQVHVTVKPVYMGFTGTSMDVGQRYRFYMTRDQQGMSYGLKKGKQITVNPVPKTSWLMEATYKGYGLQAWTWSNKETVGGEFSQGYSMTLYDAETGELIRAESSYNGITMPGIRTVPLSLKNEELSWKAGNSLSMSEIKLYKESWPWPGFRSGLDILKFSNTNSAIQTLGAEEIYNLKSKIDWWAVGVFFGINDNSERFTLSSTFAFLVSYGDQEARLGPTIPQYPNPTERNNDLFAGLIKYEWELGFKIKKSNPAIGIGLRISNTTGGLLAPEWEEDSDRWGYNGKNISNFGLFAFISI